jgi:hypothetical protein
MADVPVPGFKKFWSGDQSTSKSEYPGLVNKYPDSDGLIKQVYKVLCDIEDLAGYTPPSVGESNEWTSVVITTCICLTPSFSISENVSINGSNS